MNKLSKIINTLSEEDLLKIKRDLVAGNVDKLVDNRLKNFQEIKLSSKNCPVCDGPISSSCFVLEFGEPYIRRRAYFDGVDCLEYFVNTHLKKENKIQK
jgi:hypothetical protein